jgi:hypothetical protein
MEGGLILSPDGRLTEWFAETAHALDGVRHTGL